MITVNINNLTIQLDVNAKNNKEVETKLRGALNTLNEIIQNNTNSIFGMSAQIMLNDQTPIDYEIVPEEKDDL